MTIKDVSDVLGLKVRTIRKWVGTGKIEAVKAGRRWEIPESAVYSKEVQERADKGREHSRRVKEGIELGMLARGSKDSKESV